MAEQRFFVPDTQPTPVNGRPQDRQLESGAPGAVRLPGGITGIVMEDSPWPYI